MTYHDAFIGHARQRHDLIGCREIDGWCLASFEHIYASSIANVNSVLNLGFLYSVKLSHRVVES